MNKYNNNNLNIDLDEPDIDFDNYDYDNEDLHNLDTSEEEEKPKNKKKIIIIIIAVIIILLLLITFSGANKVLDTYNRGKATRNDVIDYYKTTVYKSEAGEDVQWYCVYDKQTESYETYVEDGAGNYIQIYPVSGIWDATTTVKSPTVQLYYVKSDEITGDIGQYIAIIENQTFDEADITYQKAIYNDNVEVTIGLLRDGSAIVCQDVKTLASDKLSTL